MLFDLRGRGRRTTVRGVYLALAVLMGGGLILFGVGTGVGGGGLLNAFSGNGGSSQSQAISSAERQAEKAVKTHPNSPTAWASLLQASWESAIANGTGFNQSTGQFTKSGISELHKVSQAWQKYLELAKSPSASVAQLAAEAYGALKDYSGEASAWEAAAVAAPSDRSYGCLALSAYAAGDTRKGDLAAAKAVSLSPKAQQKSTQLQLKLASNSRTSAQQDLLKLCGA